MGQGENIDQVLNFVDKFKIPLIIGFLGLLLIGLSLLLPKLNSQETPELKVEDSVAKTESETKTLTVDVSGEVKSPGVYQLSEGDRIEDAIKKAGGFTSQADSAWVAKELNLAAKISDGQKIYIQRSGEISTSTLGSSSQSSKININFASTKELDSLPGVGSVTIEKIVSNRPYSQVEELLTKKVVGKATFEKIKDLVSVN